MREETISIQPRASDFVQLDTATRDRCADCGVGDRLGFQFDFAYQPIVDLASRRIYAHEALVRGPQGEGAPSVLEQVTAIAQPNHPFRRPTQVIGDFFQRFFGDCPQIFVI